MGHHVYIIKERFFGMSKMGFNQHLHYTNSISKKIEDVMKKLWLICEVTKITDPE